MKFLKIPLTSLVIVFLIKTFAFTSCIIPFSGMENSLYEGERVLVNKWSYGLRSPFSCLFNYQRWLKKQPYKNDIIVFNNPLSYPEVNCLTTKEIFIGRCIGLPGDTLMLDDKYNPTDQKIQSPDYKSLYSYPKEQEDLLINLLIQLNIRNNELISYRGDEFIRNFSHYEVYLLKQKSGNKLNFTPLQLGNNIESHPFILPKKGITVTIYPWNKKLICSVITNYEEKSAEIKDDTLFLEGNPITTYTFTKDYYWMSSNNSVNFNDSRLFGFVPEDCLIGKTTLIWFSKEKNSNLFEGYRWNRFFKTVK